MRHLFKTLSFALSMLACSANAALYVGGYSTSDPTAADTQLIKSLDALGETYTQITPTSLPTSLSQGDILVIGINGYPPTSPLPDINAWLDAGVDLILVGGAATPEWVTWTQNYFNTIPKPAGFSTDYSDLWTSLGDTYVTKYLPTTYTIQADFVYAFYMQSFLATPNTTLYAQNGQTPSEYIGAVRDYENGGSFNYLSYAWGTDFLPLDEAFMADWLRGSLEYARYVPEPLPVSLFAAALIMLFVRRKQLS